MGGVGLSTAHLTTKGEMGDGDIVQKNIELLGPLREALPYLPQANDCAQERSSFFFQIGLVDRLSVALARALSKAPMFSRSQAVPPGHCD